MSRPAVFLDRDGVLNVEAGYIQNVEDLNLIPGVAQAVRRLNDRAIFTCLVSNQSYQHGATILPAMSRHCTIDYAVC